MDWNHEAKQDLIDGLQDGYTRATLNALLDRMFGRSLEYWAANGAFQNQVIELVTFFHDTEPDMLIALALSAAKDIPDDIKLRAAARHAADLKKALSVLRSNLWLQEGPWINRDTLTGWLDELPNPNEAVSRVIMVRGDDRTGRSFTHRYLRHLERVHKKSFRLAFVDLTEIVDDCEPGPNEIPTINALALAQVVAPLVSRELSEHVRDISSDEFKLTPFVSTLVRVVRESGKRLVLVIDGFGHVSPSPGVYKLLEKIGRSMDTQFQGEAHLVLLGYDKDTPTPLAGFALETTLRGFSQTDLEKFFVNFYHQVVVTANPAFKFTPDDVAEKILEVLGGVNLNAAPNVETVAGVVKTHCVKLMS